MKEMFNKLLRYNNIRNIMKMMTGTVSGQMISAILVPVGSRLYGAELYGDLAVFSSAATIFVSFLGFGLSAAIMVEDTDEKAAKTYKFAVIATNVVVFLVAIVLLLLAPFVHVINVSLPYTVSVVLLAFYAMTANQINLLYAWLNRKGRYNVLLVNPIITPLVNNGLLIILAIIGLKSIGLYAGMIVSQLATLLHMFVKMDKMPYKVRIKDIKEVIGRNRDFIFYAYPADIVNNVVGNLPVQILSACFGNTVVGYYSMAMKLLNVPSGFISNSVSRVYFKDAMDKERAQGSAREYTYKVSRIVTGIYFIPVMGILLLGQWVIPFVLGAEWAGSVIYIKIMAIWNLFAIAVQCTAGLVAVIHKQRFGMLVSVVKLFIFPISMIGMSSIFNSPILTVATYAITYSIINIVQHEYLIGSKKGYRFKIVKMQLFYAVCCGLVFVVGKALQSFWP